MAVLSRIIPLGRVGAADEVAQVALLVASDAAFSVTGSTYSVDGGMARYSQQV